MKILSGRTAAVRRRIFTADLWRGPIRETAMPPRDPDCPCCGAPRLHLPERPPRASQLVRTQRRADSRTPSPARSGSNSPRASKASAQSAPTNLHSASPPGTTTSRSSPTAAPSSRAPPMSASPAASIRNTSATEFELIGVVRSSGVVSRLGQCASSAAPVRIR